MAPELLFASVDEPELNGLLSGKSSGVAFPWHGRYSLARVPTGSFGVLCKKRRDSNFLQPLAIVAREEEFRRLFGRFAQVRSDLSPLTTWCHLFSSKRFESIDELSREANLGGLEAAWTGLAVAEAMLLSEMPVSRLKIAACLATQSFAIARTKALWDNSIKEILERYDSAHQMFRAKESRTIKLRTALDPVWASLSAASDYESKNHSLQLAPLVEGIRALHRARLDNDPEEASQLFIPLAAVVREAEVLHRLPQLTPEQRVREFDKVISGLSAIAPNESLVSRHALAMLAGYLSTVAAGGAPSLSLLEPHAQRWPEMTAWAYVLGSVGQQVVWTSSFDGLGRLVIRELMRSLRLDEAPTCDFSLDEAAVLFDSQLTDPLVHLRIKQSRIVTVSLTPGVNILVPLGEQIQEARSTDSLNRERAAEGSDRSINAETLELVSEAVWRRLRGRIERYVEALSRDSFRNYERGRPIKRSSAQSKLPLKGPDDK